jgi:hypothetical protein
VGPVNSQGSLDFRVAYQAWSDQVNGELGGIRLGNSTAMNATYLVNITVCNDGGYRDIGTNHKVEALYTSFFSCHHPQLPPGGLDYVLSPFGDQLTQRALAVAGRAANGPRGPRGPLGLAIPTRMAPHLDVICCESPD